MDYFAIKAAPRSGYCCVRYCRDKLPAKRCHTGLFCRRCKDRRYAATNPLAYTFNKLRNNAKRRKIDFTLTRAEWEMFCEATGYDRLRGKLGYALTVDRIDRTLGYHLDNIQTLTNSDNVSKGNKERLTGDDVVQDILPPDASDAPF